MLKYIFTVAFYAYLLISCRAYAQVVTLNPSFPTQTDNVTVTFDASKGNAALAGQTAVYAHTGVITSLSTSPSDWKHVQGNWGTDDAKVKMTSIGNNKFQLTYNIASFYGVSAPEKILKLAFVFRNQDGSKVGRNADGSDIFAEISDGSFQLSLSTSPSGTPPILSITDTLKVHIQSSAKALLSLYINDSLYTSLPDTSELNVELLANGLVYGKHKITAKGIFNSTEFIDSAFFITRISSASQLGETPAGIKDGINYLNDSTVILQLLAPGKNYVYVIGDFNNWQLDPAYEMTKTPDNKRFWLQLNRLEPGKEYRYQYSIDKVMLRVADPFADKQLDQYNDQYIDAVTYPGLIPYPAGKTTEYVSVLQTAQQPFNWQHSTAFTKPQSKKLVIYELLIRDFIGKHNYLTLIDTLDYLQRLGINAIEVLPFNEFEGNESWGYNTAFHFAPDKYYGTKNHLKSFIDECHRRGIAVIMDMVLNHSFGQSSMVRMYFDNSTGKPLNNPWFNTDATHPYNVGFDFNHESLYTKNFVDTVLKYWVNEYKVDGYRFDLSKGFTQNNNPDNIGAWNAYDQSRINILKRISDNIRPACSDCYLILEHFADNSEEKVLSDYGFMLWGNINHDFNEATMGYASDVSWASYKQRGWASPNVVAYAESHDEERLMYKNIMFGSTSPAYNIKDTVTALARCEAAAVMLASLPGPYMIWQFGELGYNYSINHCPNGTISEACRIANKPIRWDYLNEPSRKRLYDVYAAINTLKTTSATFQTSDFTYSLNQPFKTLLLKDSNMNVLVAANFGTARLKNKVSLPHAGVWYDYFTGDSATFSGVNDTITLEAGKYVLYTDVRLQTPVITFPTALNEITADDKHMSIYPNPARDMVNINTTERAVSYTVYDISGKCILKGTFNGSQQINTSALQTGYYLLKIHTANSSLTRKLLINR